MDAASRAAAPPPKPKKKKAKAVKNSSGPFGSVLGGARAVSGNLTHHMIQDSSIPLSKPFSGSESIGSVSGTSAFTSVQYPINPCQAGTFPRLSRELSNLWDFYEFDELILEFRPSITEFATNAFGRVVLGVDYDAADAPPSSLQQAEDSRPSVSGLPSDSLFLKLRKKDMNGWMKRHFCRPGNLPGGSDIKMYDVGVLNFSTSGNVNTNAIGELWLHNRGQDHMQVLESLSTAPHNYTLSVYQDASPVSATSGIAKVDPLATVVMNGLSAVNSGGSIVLPAGNYLAKYLGSFSATVLQGQIADLELGGVVLLPYSAARDYGVSSSVASDIMYVEAAFATDGTKALIVNTNTSGTGTPLIQGVLTIMAV